MKKIIICICICLSLTGCGNKKTVTHTTVLPKQTVADIKEKDDTLKGMTKTAKNKNSTKKALKALRIAIKGKKIILKDLVQDKTVKTYKLKKKQCADLFQETDIGYCVRIFEANRELKDHVVDGFTVYDTPDVSEIVNVSLKYFDKNLNEVDTIDISKLAKQKKCEELLMTNFSVRGDGMLIAWDIGENVLCYNRQTKKISQYKQFYMNDIIADNIAFVGNNILAFFGSKGEMEKDTCYGYLNLSDKKVTSFVEKKYQAFSLYSDKRYMWLNDGENPKDGKSSGKFIMVDTKTRKNNIIHLDNIESTKAAITENGKYIIAISQTEEKSFRIRQYNVADGRILKEKNYKFSNDIHASDIIPIDGRIYGIIYGTDKGEKLEKFVLMN